MSHTPGPWTIISHDMGDEDIMFLPTGIRGSDGKTIISFDGGLCPEDFEGDVAAIRANAALVASAPEMLELLLELRECAEYWSEYDVPLGVVKRLDETIRKARGEE